MQIKLLPQKWHYYTAGVTMSQSHKGQFTFKFRPSVSSTVNFHRLHAVIIRVQRSCDGWISPSNTRRRLIFSCDRQAERLLVVSQILKAENKQTLSGVFVISPQWKTGNDETQCLHLCCISRCADLMIRLSAASSSGSHHCCNNV